MDYMRSGFPLSLRPLREMHEILLKLGRGASKQLGEVSPFTKLDWRYAPR
jgi:hypothetical protein